MPITSPPWAGDTLRADFAQAQHFYLCHRRETFSCPEESPAKAAAYLNQSTRWHR
jgi:hypothetical protein